LVSVVLGFVPTLKSLLESAVISEIDQAFRSPPPDAEAAFTAPVQQFSADSGGIDGAIGSVATFVFDDVALWVVVVAYAAVTGLGWLLGIASAALRAHVTRRFFNALRREGMERALHGELPRGGVTNEPGQDANAIQFGATSLASSYSVAVQALQFFFALGVACYAVFQLSPLLMTLLIFIVVVQALVTWLQVRLLQTDRERLDERRHQLAGQSDDILSKRDIILAHERGPYYAAALAGGAESYAEVEQRLAWREEAFRGFGRLVADFGRIGVLVAALIVIVATDTAFGGVGDAYFVLSLYWRMLAPAQGLLGAYEGIRGAAATSQRFIGLLGDNDSALAEPGQAAPRGAVGSEFVAFRDVEFRYGDGTRPVLTGCSFIVPAKQTTLLLGRSGAGKTTIARLLLGFLRPQGGDVLVEGTPSTDWIPADLRLRMSYIAQGDNVVEGSVRENLFHDEIDDDRCGELLVAVGLLRPDATTEERTLRLEKAAKELSGGEQQRLALARALADDAPLVIMDEPLAGVDAFTFRDVAPRLERFFDEEDKTILLISHRLSFVAFADHVIVLGDAGRVTEEGPIVALLEGGGEFAELYSTAVQELIPHMTFAELRAHAQT
jgi:ABC-type multidrug transport system fused ATPase/permease subunit